MSPHRGDASERTNHKPNGNEAMSDTRTLAIIKPDAFGSGKAGKIIDRLESDGFRILAARVVHLSRAGAEAFYDVHRGKPFFTSLVDFMTSGPVLAMPLEREDAVTRLREVIGATDPADADTGTVRALYGESKERNAIHASDSPDNARVEVAFFFAGVDLA